MDPERDPEVAGRKRRAKRLGKGRAVCTRCYRPPYPGMRFCQCGSYHPEGWEQQFAPNMAGPRRNDAARTYRTTWSWHRRPAQPVAVSQSPAAVSRTPPGAAGG